jgi:hypothetical protein
MPLDANTVNTVSKWVDDVTKLKTPEVKPSGDPLIDLFASFKGKRFYYYLFTIRRHKTMCVTCQNQGTCGHVQ